MHNLGHTGLTFWSPNVNVIRDPRWGRVMETPGEDPFVVGRYGVNFVRGLQDVKGHEATEDLDSRPLKVSSCCKHYAAYDVESWMGVDRWHFDSRVTEQDMMETFLRPLEMCVKEGDLSSVMCSFNKINGIPACADHRLLAHTIRKDWNLHGYIVSDCDSIKTIAQSEKWINDTAEDAVQQGLRAGLDLDCGIYYQQYMGSAAANGKIRETDVDNALKNLIVVLMRVGYFDGNPMYDSLGEDDICTVDSMELSADSARQEMVLLKNNNDVLPLDKSKYPNIAMLGPHANATDAMIGNYAGTPCRYISPLNAFSAEVVVDYFMGCDVACSNDTLIPPAVRAAKKADATIIFVGLDLNTEAEGRDRTDFLLPGNQTNLIKRVARASKGPVILVLLCAGGVDIKFAVENPKISAIVWAGYPGAEGGRAMADVIFGRYNPGGRLPITWYEASYVDSLPMTSMFLRPAHHLGYPGRRYKFYNGSTIFPFGYGLSYTTFNYTLSPPSSSAVTTRLGTQQFCRPLSYRNNETIITPSCPAIGIKDAPCTEEVQFDLVVTNTGSMDGSHVVIVYGVPPKEVAAGPIKQVVGFKRVFVRAGKSETVRFLLNICKSMSIVDESAYWVLPSGEHRIQIGHEDGAPNFPLHVKFRY